MGDTIDITGLDRAEVLAALYNAARPAGIGDDGTMTAEDARQHIADHHTYLGFNNRYPLDFDYVRGRVLKVNLGPDHILVDLYDRDNGRGAARKALDPLIKARRQEAPDGSG